MFLKTKPILKMLSPSVESPNTRYLWQLQKVGFDRRVIRCMSVTQTAKKLKSVEERIRINGHNVVRKRRSKILDDDLPKIAKAWKEFPGIRLSV